MSFKEMQVSGREKILKLITMERVLTRAVGTFYEVFYRKIHYLTREFHVKLHLKTDIHSSLRDSRDIGFQVQFNVEFQSQLSELSLR